MNTSIFILRVTSFYVELHQVFSIEENVFIFPTFKEYSKASARIFDINHPVQNAKRKQSTPQKNEWINHLELQVQL